MIYELVRDGLEKAIKIVRSRKHKSGFDIPTFRKTGALAKYGSVGAGGGGGGSRNIVRTGIAT